MYCRSCQLGQLAPLPAREEIARIYGSRSYFEGDDHIGYSGYVADAPQLARTFRAKLDHLLRYGPVEDMLEIGCGPGYLLREARAAGIANAVGVDLNPWAVAQARRGNLQAHVGSIEDLPAEQRFDAVIMLDLLEHVRDPDVLLAEIRRRLRPSGRVFLMTPNIRSALARLSGRRWVSFKLPEHLYYHSPRSMRALLGRSGFEVLSIRGAGQYVTLEFLFDRLGRLLPRLAAVGRRVCRALGAERRVVFVTNGSVDVLARVAAAPGTP